MFGDGRDAQSGCGAGSLFRALVLCASTFCASEAAYAQQHPDAGEAPTLRESTLHDAAPHNLQDTDENPRSHPFFSSLRAIHPARLLGKVLGGTIFGAQTANPRALEITRFFEGEPKAPGLGLAGAFGTGPPPARSHDFWFRAPPTRNVVFTSFDATERDRFFSTGFKRAIRGHLDEPGFRLMATLGMKIREYDAALGVSQSRLHAARLVTGYEWKFADLSITVMGGGSFVLNTTDATQQTRRLGRFGPTGMVELWQNWGNTAAFGSRFTTLFAMLDQASRSSYFRLRHGFAYSDGPLRFGPEVAFATGESQFRRGVRLQTGWRKVRLGAHLGEIPLRQARLSFSGGIDWQGHRNPGGYLQLAAYLRY